MAGDWIPMRLDLAEDPAVMRMAEMLGMPEPCIVGYLHTIWSWASRQCDAGSVTGVSPKSLGRVTRCETIPDAMVAVGWLEEVEIDGTPSIRFPNWERWLSQSAKSRALTARRMASKRLRDSDAASVTESSPQYSTVQESIKTPLSPLTAQGGTAGNGKPRKKTRAERKTEEEKRIEAERAKRRADNQAQLAKLKLEQQQRDRKGLYDD